MKKIAAFFTVIVFALSLGIASAEEAVMPWERNQNEGAAGTTKDKYKKTERKKKEKKQVKKQTVKANEGEQKEKEKKEKQGKWWWIPSFFK